MDKELKDRVKEILKDHATPSREGGPKTFSLTHSHPSIDFETVNYLESKGCLTDRGGHYIITAQGRDYLGELTTWTPWYWFKKNWFPFLAILSTLIIGISTVATNIWRIFISCG